MVAAENENCVDPGYRPQDPDRDFAYGLYRNERRGYKLICTVRVMPEGLTILRTDPLHPAFESWTGKRIWYEKERVAQRFIRVPRYQTMHSVRSTISQARGHVPRQRARRHGWAQLPVSY